MNTRNRTSARFIQPYRYASPRVPFSAIKRFARRIAQKFQPEKIILFGSYAYGTPHEESDVDLLVVMPTRNPIDQAIRIDLAFKRPFSLDLMVRTPKQIERGLSKGDCDWFLREIMEKGKVLYEAAHGSVGSQGRGRPGRGTRPGRRQATASRPGVLSLPADGREIPQGARARNRRGRTTNSRSGGSS
jgi:predicted nucleotidyltransferase